MTRMSKSPMAFRPHIETFKGVRWHRANRLGHEAYRPDPRFSAACKVDWSRILKRPDPQHSDGRQVAIAARDLSTLGRQFFRRRAYYHIVYIKRVGYLWIVSICYANDEQISRHLAFYP
jgi:hypothetical protein